MRTLVTIRYAKMKLCRFSMEEMLALMELHLYLFLPLENRIVLVQNIHLYSCLSERGAETIISWGQNTSSSTKYIA